MHSGERDVDGVCQEVVGEVAHAFSRQDEVILGSVFQAFVLEGDCLAADRALGGILRDALDEYVVDVGHGIVGHLHALVESEHNLARCRNAGGIVVRNGRHEHGSHAVVDELGRAGDEEHGQGVTIVGRCGTVDI